METMGREIWCPILADKVLSEPPHENGLRQGDDEQHVQTTFVAPRKGFFFRVRDNGHL